VKNLNGLLTSEVACHLTIIHRSLMSEKYIGKMNGASGGSVAKRENNHYISDKGGFPRF